MIYFKSCPKCITGAMYEHSGLDGLEKKCVNCAFVLYETAIELTPSNAQADSVELIASA